MAKTLAAMELVDPIKPAKIACVDDDDQLPPLMAMIIEGFPPLDQSKYTREAETIMKQHADRWQINSFGSYLLVGLSSASYMHPKVISVERLVTIGKHYAAALLLDDLFIDAPDVRRLDDYGIDRSTLDNPQKVRDYLDHLNMVFGQRQPPGDPASKMELIMAELGRDMLQLSNSERFDKFVDDFIAHHRSSVSSLAEIDAGDNSCVLDLEAYTRMRAGNVGGVFLVFMVEFSSNVYILSAMNSGPYMQKVFEPTGIQIGFANDVYSYHKESSLEGNPRNLITLLMETEGMSFVRAVHAAIKLTNKYSRALVDLEADAWNPLLKHHLQEVKALCAGNIYFGIFDKRYRQRDSVFPEQRDVTSSWKLPLHHSQKPDL